ncbi:MAG: DUF4232 domain-containing protein [bacterium]
MTNLRLGLAIGILAAIGCGLVACGGDDASTPTIGATSTAIESTRVPTTPAAAATSSSTQPVPTVRRCATADLALATESGGAAAGTHFLALILTNTSGADCTVSGFPGVSLVDGVGQQVGEPAERNTAVAVQTLTLKPSESAHATAGFPNFQNFPSGKCAGPSVNLKVFPPDELNALTVPLIDYACPGFSVQVFKPGKTDQAGG